MREKSNREVIFLLLSFGWFGDTSLLMNANGGRNLKFGGVLAMWFSI